jgi:hypothetical protein
MGRTLMLWLCALPFVVLIVLPLWGSRVALVSALVLLVVMRGICWAICSVRLPDEEQKVLKQENLGYSGCRPGRMSTWRHFLQAKGRHMQRTL